MWTFAGVFVTHKSKYFFLFYINKNVNEFLDIYFKMSWPFIFMYLRNIYVKMRLHYGPFMLHWLPVIGVRRMCCENVVTRKFHSFSWNGLEVYTIQINLVADSRKVTYHPRNSWYGVLFLSHEFVNEKGDLSYWIRTFRTSISWAARKHLSLLGVPGM